MTKREKIGDVFKRLGKEIPPFEELGSRPCRICGKPNDHIHHRWDPILKRNVIVEEPDE